MRPALLSLIFLCSLIGKGDTSVSVLARRRFSLSLSLSKVQVFSLYDNGYSPNIFLSPDHNSHPYPLSLSLLRKTKWWVFFNFPLWFLFSKLFSFSPCHLLMKTNWILFMFCLKFLFFVLIFQIHVFIIVCSFKSSTPLAWRPAVWKVLQRLHNSWGGKEEREEHLLLGLLHESLPSLLEPSSPSPTFAGN